MQKLRSGILYHACWKLDEKSPTWFCISENPYGQALQKYALSYLSHPSSFQAKVKLDYVEEQKLN